MVEGVVGTLQAITCELGLTKIGIAPEPRQRLRALQVGSPVPLELGWFLRLERADHAYAVLADVARQLEQQGSWYRVTPLEVRHAAGDRSAAQAPRETDEARLRAPAAEAEAQREQSERLRSRRREQLQTRRQKLRALAELRAGGATQVEAVTQLGVDERTIRRWMKLPGYEAALAKARARKEQAAARAQSRPRKRR